jgi:hypothetical protein
MTRDDRLTERAKELYQVQKFCESCGEELTLHDLLMGRCPRCEAIQLAGPDITHQVGRAMLHDLEQRRRELGLGVLTLK